MAVVDYTGLVSGQRDYFHSGATRPVEWRRQQLEALKALLEENRARFFAALHQDIRRNDTDSDLMDVGVHVKEADTPSATCTLDEARARCTPPWSWSPGTSGPPRPARCHPDHRRVERAADAHLRPPGPGDRRREHGRDQAVGDVRRHLGTARRTGAQVPGHRAQSRWSRARSRRRPPCWTRTGTSSSSPAARRSARSSTRRRPGTSPRPCSNSAGRTPPSCTPRQHQLRRPAHRLQPLHQLRPHLHRARPRTGVARSQGRIRPPD